MSDAIEPTDGPAKPIYVKQRRATELFGISRDKMYRLKRKGLLRIANLDGCALVKVSDMVALIEGTEAK